jgi:hypothetical protein
MALRRFPVFGGSDQLFEGAAAFKQHAFQRRLERLFIPASSSGILSSRTAFINRAISPAAWAGVCMSTAGA